MIGALIRRVGHLISNKVLESLSTTMALLLACNGVRSVRQPSRVTKQRRSARNPLIDAYRAAYGVNPFGWSGVDAEA